MRGTRCAGTAVGIVRRFIPAHAGNTQADDRGAHRRTVHPRACGEHGISRSMDADRHGSSPRMRGTLLYELLLSVSSRFIPAHAGNTMQLPPSPVAWSGSSPRMRGTLVGGMDIPVATRFIPAHAGNTLTTARPTKSTTVHPRACGEHSSQKDPPIRARGSSPRMRGTRTRRAAIPLPTPVHPRACGEHDTDLLAALNLDGSSPRMRGTHDAVRPLLP